MNIFAIGGNEKTGEINWHESAQQIDDLRCSKMIVESCQILSTVLNEKGLNGPYKSFNPHHPSILWAGESKSNFENLIQYTEYLIEEYHKRYNNKFHKCEIALQSIKEQFEKCFFTRHESTPLKMAISISECIIKDNPVLSYRNFWRTKRLLYRRSEIPSWLWGSFS